MIEHVPILKGYSIRVHVLPFPGPQEGPIQGREAGGGLGYGVDTFYYTELSCPPYRIPLKVAEIPPKWRKYIKHAKYSIGRRPSFPFYIKV